MSMREHIIRGLLAQGLDEPAALSAERLAELPAVSLQCPFSRVLPVLDGVFYVVLGPSLRTRSDSEVRGVRLNIRSTGLALLDEADSGAPIEADHTWMAQSLTSFALEVDLQRAHSLSEYVRRYFPPRMLNPYRSDRDPNEAMFIGRGDLVRDLAAGSGTSVVIGPRRIGKTSLAKAVVRRVRSDQDYQLAIPGSGDRYVNSAVYIDAEKLDTPDPAGIWTLLLESMAFEAHDLQPGSRLRRSLDVSRGKSVKHRLEARTPQDLVQRLLVQKYKRALIVLDECDKMVAWDAPHYDVFRALQAMVDDSEGRTALLLVGYGELQEAIESNEFPLNKQRAHVVHITRLTQNETRDLVVGPMQTIGVTVSDVGEVVGRVYHVTGGLPSLVQDVCRALLQRKDVNSDRRITIDRLEDTLGRDAFKDRLMFLFDQVRAPLARLVGYLAATSAPVAATSQPEVLFRDLLGQLHDSGLVEVDDRTLERALRGLVLYNVLLPQQQSERLGGASAYVFSTARLWQLIQQQIDSRGREVVIRSLVEQCRRDYWSAPGSAS